MLPPVSHHSFSSPLCSTPATRLLSASVFSVKAGGVKKAD